VRIVVIAPQEPAAFFDLLWQGVWERPPSTSLNSASRSPRYDVEAQRSILADLLHERVDAIAMVPVHDSALDDLIGRHAARGASVVTFHSDAPRSGRTLFVEPDAFHSGVLAGELLSKLMVGSDAS
jgi:ABC-type sugar transport system substrate-binding protein